MTNCVTMASIIGALFVASSASAGAVIEIDAGYYEGFGGMVLIINNPSSYNFSDLKIVSVAGNGVGQSVDLGSLTAMNSGLYLFSEPTGVFSFDADDLYGGAATFQIDAVFGGQTFLSQTFSEAANASKHYVGFQGDSDFDPIKVADLIVRPAGVPGPTSWVLMTLGLGGVGAAMRSNVKAGTIRSS